VERALRYTPSLSSLAALPESAGPISGSFVVGDPAMPLGLAALPAAAIEADEVARLLSTEAFGDQAATETLARTRMSSAAIIHLATHGYAYSEENRRRDSFVVLASDDQNDGLLTVGEILDDPRLELTAELVVLSACQTGLGSLHAAEGTVGLQRAFLGRGAGSVLVSLWNVSDEATLALMLAFYGHWLNDDDEPSKAEALRRAQTDVRSKPQYEHPKYWAAFQLVGLN